MATPEKIDVAAEVSPIDNRSAAEKAQTAHLATFAPLKVEDESTPAAAPDSTGLKLPANLKKTLELLSETQNSRYENDPELSSGENLELQKKFERARAVKEERIREHLHVIQQGPKTPILTAAAHQSLSEHTSQHATAFKLNELARSHPEVRVLLAERDDLLKQIETLTKK